MSKTDMAFRGAKLMLFAGPFLVVLRRDHTPGIAWPGRLDFPGGGREGCETPEACALREAFEEVGLHVPPEAVQLAFVRRTERGSSYFFAAHLPEAALHDVVFGGEGAGWLPMRPEEYIASPEAIPHFAQILKTYLNQPDVKAG